MKRRWAVPAAVLLCSLVAPTTARSQHGIIPLIASWLTNDTLPHSTLEPDFVPREPGIPDTMLDLMRISQLRYQQGSDLIKLGNSTSARASFDLAVRMILDSEWDLPSNPPLRRFYEELLERIRLDEELFLPREESVDEPKEDPVLNEIENLELIPISIDPSLRDSVEADLAETRYDIPVTLNEQVLQSLNYWLNRGRKYFSDGLVRSGRYRDMIQRIFREESIPQDVIFLAQVESLFKITAYSRKHAKGLWQFGVGTAIRYGLKVNSHIDERSDPEKSTRAAARYLRDLYGMFQDWNLAMAAYNWGEGRVQKLVHRSGMNDFWDLTELRRNFPKETKKHIPMIMASIIIGRNPERYGFPTELDPALKYEKVSVPKPIDLKSAAKLMDISLEELKALNPGLRRNTTPAAYPDYELNIPAELDRSVVEQIAALPAVKPEPLGQGRHRVRPGDTLWDLAVRYRVSVQALQALNGIHSPRALKIGMWLEIPSPRR